MHFVVFTLNILNINYLCFSHVIYLPEKGEEVEPGKGEGEGPELPLPGEPEPGGRGAGVHVPHHQHLRPIRGEHGVT